MVCPHCGQVNAAGAQACLRCGNALSVPPAAYIPQVPPPAPHALPVTPMAGGIPFQAPSASYAQPAANMVPAATPVRVNEARKRKAPSQKWQGPMVQCRLCGAFNVGYLTCRTCQAPSGLIANPGDPTGATFLPLGMLYPPPLDALELAPSRVLPPALANLRWNWGAFGASLLWLTAHRLWSWALFVLLLDTLALLSFYGPLYLLIPYGGALLSLGLGMQGHFLAWQQRADGNETAFLHTETRWKWIGSVGLVVKIALLALLTHAAWQQR